MADGFVEIHGIDDLNRDLRRFATKDAQKAVNRAHRQVGTAFIERMLRPRPDKRAVGEGRGSTVRPSASKREVLLRVGGKHRASGSNTELQPWGVRRGNRDAQGRFRPAPERPYIRRSVAENEDKLHALYLEKMGDEFDLLELS